MIINYNIILFTAFAGAVIGQILIILIGWAKTELDRKTKKELIVSDLNNQLKLTERLRKAHQELLEKFEKRAADNHTYDSFEDLHTDMYESITKPDLFKIFGSRMVNLVKIYKTISFLETYSVDRIYKDYLVKVEAHTKEKRDDKDHNRYCSTHIGYMDSAISQLKNNLESVDDLEGEIKIFIK
jgi:hypothetical protein